MTSDSMQALPNHLAERTRALNNRTFGKAGEFVLYWLRTAVRADENPALDASTHWANLQGLPVLVYHTIAERSAYASDRHHTFQLEGARDLAQQIQTRGVTYAFHLAKEADREPCLLELANRAAFVVTEDMPVEPLSAWTQRLASETTTPVFAVDTACVVPMQLVGKARERAFQFRSATEKLFLARVDSLFPPILPSKRMEISGRLPFEPIDWSTASIPDLVAQCDIDHTIGPVPHTRGGSTAGYARWNAFCDRGIDRYAQRRNDALVDGVSRLSAYLHYGMVAPTRIAREANQWDQPGCKKYLDELFVWREIAYNFCRYRSEHDSLDAIPDWAVTTLAEHESDPRPAIYDWETLARGRTNDPLWNAAQRSLLMQGELHNNVRMTWGKMLLNWKPNAALALEQIIDLNHRYALDGRDPASYGGILWCLGQFDRPFPPPQPIFGTVRGRSTAEHAKRLDPDAYLKKTTRPLFAPNPTVAVIGAGLSGLMTARTLADHGLEVVVFEKSRGVGGRMATRRSGDELRFDHGAQYFTARDERFRRYVKSWEDQGLVAEWTGQIVDLIHGKVAERTGHEPRFVALPGMNSICKHLAQSVSIRFESEVARVEEHADGWYLFDASGKFQGAYDFVLSSAPAPQTSQLLAASDEIAQAGTRCAMQGCWALMIALSQPMPVSFDGAFVHDSPISWMARNSSKPQRGNQVETWVIHGSHEWSQTRIDESPPTIQPQLLNAFFQAIGRAPETPVFASTHRWRHAIPSVSPDAQGCLFDAVKNLGACGDWCLGPRVEAAFLSGAALAGRVLGKLQQR